MKNVPGTIAAGVLCLAIAFPMFAQAAEPGVKGASNAQIAHGEYLVKDMGGCADCHTPKNNKGEPLPGQWLKGSKLSFAPLAPVPGWADTAPSIAGLAGWDTQQTVHFLMTGIDPAGHPARPPMPLYRMNRADAESVAAYLKSLK